MRDHVFCTFFFNTFHIQSFVLVTTNSSLVDWILFTKAHDVSTKRLIGGSQVFFYSYVIQKFAVEIWMTRIKLWNAGVNASFVLLALRKYLRAKGGTLMIRKFFYSFLSNVSYPDFCTAKHQLITNSSLLDWRLCNKACETRLIHGNNKKAYWGIKWFFYSFFFPRHTFHNQTFVVCTAKHQLITMGFNNQY